jgi:hypothetical protein
MGSLSYPDGNRVYNIFYHFRDQENCLYKGTNWWLDLKATNVTRAINKVRRALMEDGQIQSWGEVIFDEVECVG